MSGWHLRILNLAMLLSWLPFFAIAQISETRDSLQRILDQLSSAALPAEKVFIHSDRSLYISGERIWYKILCLNAASQLPTELSRAVYVELLNNENQQVTAQVICLAKGSGNGVIEIPSNLASGIYYLIAYTGWMKNAGPDHYFLKTLKILNPFQPVLPEENQSTGTATKKWPVYFYPEGGILLADAENQLVLTAHDQYGKPAAVKGIIKDQDDKPVVSFSSDKSGQGSVRFIPETDRQYKAVVEQGVSNAEYLIPPVQSESWLLSLTSRNESNLVLTLHHPTGFTGKPAFVVIYSEGRYRYIQTVTLTAIPAVINLAASSLGYGTNYILVIDNHFEPICYRPVFRSQQTSLKPMIQNLQMNYKNRDKVALSFKLGSLPGMYLTSDLSVAVVLDDDEKPVTDLSIQNYLSVSPGFDRGLLLHESGNTDDMTSADMQMIIMGNTSPPWKIVATPHRDSIFLPEMEGQVLSGSLRNKVSAAPEVNKAVYFSWVGETRDVKLTYTNSDGRYFFKLPEGEGNRPIFIQTPASQDESILFVDAQFSRRFVKPHPFIFNLSEYSKKYLEQLLLNYQTAVAYKTNEKKMTSAVAGMDFYGKPNELYTMNNYIKLPVMEEFFRELVKSTILTKEKGAYKINVLDGNLNRIIGTNPGYMIDGVPIFKSSMILESDPQIFKDIRVVNSRYLYGNIGWDGIVDLSTHSGDFSDFDLPPASIRQTIQLFEYKAEYLPVLYNTAKSMANTLPDYRTLLLWNPNITTGPEGRASIEFTTSDVVGRYKIVVQGVASTGQLIYLEQAFNVGNKQFLK